MNLPAGQEQDQDATLARIIDDNTVPTIEDAWGKLVLDLTQDDCENITKGH